MILLTDADHQQMVEGLAQFREALQSSEAAMFYYAGHGFQLSERNYLLPVDFDLSSAIDENANTLDLGKSGTIGLDDVFETLDLAPGVRLVFLDSCRDNPLADLMTEKALVDIDAHKGLAEVQATGSNFLISYATAPGDVAFDGSGDNSYFTEAFLKHVTRPGLSIADLMVAVRKDVRSATHGRQTPWESSSLTNTFFFDDRPSTVSEETLLWQVATDTREERLLRLYLDRYPSGKHEAHVRTTLGEIGDENERSLELLTPEQQAERLWQVAWRSRMRSLFEIYLHRYPDGARAAEAQRMVETLPPQDDSSPAVICERLATHPNDSSARVAGNPFLKLRDSALTAIKACSAAMESFPELPHYAALLARSHAAAGDMPRAIELYELAADQGDLRALFSLAQIYEAGTNAPQDPERALSLYRRAAAAGSTDAMINLAVTMLEGTRVPHDPEGAIALLERAAAEGSGTATYNLGVLAMDETYGEPEDALDHFVRATTMGEDLGFQSAAILLDQGIKVPRDSRRAARLLLRGMVEDTGLIIDNLTTRPDAWSRELIEELQSRLSLAGYYQSDVDGEADPALFAALQTWRNGGFVAELVAD